MMAKHRAPMVLIGMMLLGITLVVLARVALIRFPAHLGLLDWPPHAKAHLIGQIGTTVALAVLSIAVLVGTFRSGQRWPWWCLALVGLAVFGSYWMARAMVEPNVPWHGGNTPFAPLTGGYFAGLALSRSHVYGRNQ